MITTYCMLEFATGRPQVAGIFFALIFHRILHNSRSDINSRQLLLLPLVMVLWVNIHGSFVAGLTIIGAYGLEAIYNKNRKWLLRLLALGAVCSLLVLANPHGIGLVTFVFSTYNSVITKYISEWRPFVFGSVLGISIWVLVFIIFSNLRSTSSFLADKILAVAWFVIMLFSIRNIGLLAVLGAPYIAANLPADNEKDANTRKLAAWINNKSWSPLLAAIVPLIMAAGYFILPLLGAQHYIEKKEMAILPAINYVLHNYPDKRIINDYDFGGRIIYESKGKLPVFIDGRAGTVYSEAVMSDYIDFLTLKEGWQEILDKYRIDVIFLKNSRDFVKDYKKGLYQDKWQEVYHDDMASIYIRRQ